eukprot:61103-Rhodomonas_salina.2
MTSATSASQLADALAQSQPSAAFIKHSVALATARSATLAITHDPSTSHQTPRFLQPEPLPEEFVPGTRRSGDHALSQRPHLNLAPTFHKDPSVCIPHAGILHPAAATTLPQMFSNARRSSRTQSPSRTALPCGEPSLCGLSVAAQTAVITRLKQGAWVTDLVRHAAPYKCQRGVEDSQRIAPRSRGGWQRRLAVRKLFRVSGSTSFKFLAECKAPGAAPRFTGMQTKPLSRCLTALGPVKFKLTSEPALQRSFCSQERILGVWRLGAAALDPGDPRPECGYATAATASVIMTRPTDDDNLKRYYLTRFDSTGSNFDGWDSDLWSTSRTDSNGAGTGAPALSFSLISSLLPPSPNQESGSSTHFNLFLPPNMQLTRRLH